MGRASEGGRAREPDGASRRSRKPGETSVVGRGGRARSQVETAVKKIGG